MKIYEDRELQIEISNCFSFGVVPVGESKTITLYIKNDDRPSLTGRLINLKFEVICLDPENDLAIEDEKVLVIDAPSELEIYGSAPLILEWTPNISLEQGLKAKLIITGNKIIG